MAAQGAAAAVLDMSQFITREEAQSEIGKLVKEQLDTFKAQRDAIAVQSQRLEEQSVEARDTSAKLATQVDKVLKQNKTDCDEQITQRVGELRAQAQAAVTTVQEKITEMEALIKAQTDAQESSQENADLSLTKHVSDMVALEEKLRVYANGVEANLTAIKDEVGRTQAEVVRTQTGIRQLIESARRDGGSVLQRPSQARGGDLRRHHRPDLERSETSSSAVATLLDGTSTLGATQL